MTKLILFGNQLTLELWRREHEAEFEGWNRTQNRFWTPYPYDHEVRLVACGRAGCEQKLRGLAVDEIEIHGPWSRNLDHAHLVARLGLRRKVAS